MPEVHHFWHCLYISPFSASEPPLVGTLVTTSRLKSIWYIRHRCKSPNEGDLGRFLPTQSSNSILLVSFFSPQKSLKPISSPQAQLTIQIKYQLPPPWHSSECAQSLLPTGTTTFATNLLSHPILFTTNCSSPCRQDAPALLLDEPTVTRYLYIRVLCG